MFNGIYKGKTLNICTNALLWEGEFLGVKDNVVTLNKATAISVYSGIEIISTPQIYVDIPLESILSVSVGKSKINESSKNTAESPILNYKSSSIKIKKNIHVLQMK